MLVWPALLLAPLVALANLAIAYSLVTPSCAGQETSPLHLVAAASTLAVIAFTGMAACDWAWGVRRLRQPARGAGAAGSDAASAPPVTASDGDEDGRRRSFLALTAALVGALSLVVCVALWMPVWMLSPCG